MARAHRVEAAGWLGLPGLPPARVLARAGRVRQRLHRATEAGPPFVMVIERLVSVYDNVVLGMLCRHGVPEALVVGPGTPEELSERIGGADPLDADALGRVLRYASVRGFVGQDRSGRYLANAVTRSLTQDEPASARPWVDFLTSASTWQILAEVDEALHGREPCRAAHGTDFFTHVNDRSPDDGVAFNGAMAQGSHVQALLLADAFDFGSVGSVIDVGGGTGGLARVLLRHHPTLDVTVFDLPAVIAAARAQRSAEAEADPAGRDRRWWAKVTWTGGDFFESLPSGADVYTLLAILHDWSDADAGRILSTVREAMAPTSRCLIVDATVDERRPQDLFVATDLLMLTLTEGGRERTTSDWERLVASARLRIDRHHTLATAFSVYELVPA